MRVERDECFVKSQEEIYLKKDEIIELASCKNKITYKVWSDTSVCVILIKTFLMPKLALKIKYMECMYYGVCLGISYLGISNIYCLYRTSAITQ